MVIAAMSILLITVIIKTDGMLESMSDSVAARRVKGDLEFCREWSMNRRDTMRIEFNLSVNPALNGYRVSAGDSLRKADNSYGLALISHPLHSKDFIVIQAEDDIRIDAATFSHNVIIPGTSNPYSAQNLFFNNMGKPVLNADGIIIVNGKTLTIDAETGEITISP
mgnify:CR=1 FL=1